MTCITFPIALDFDANYHLWSTKAMWRYPGEPDVFYQPCRDLRGLAFGKIDMRRLVLWPFKTFTFERRQ